MSEPHRYDIPKILEQMRADYWHNLETAAQDDLADLTDYMVVVFGTQRFGLPAAACREVLKVPRIVRVPRLPPHLPGIINLRGEIVAVTDLRPLLQLVAAPPTASFPAGGRRRREPAYGAAGRAGRGVVHHLGARGGSDDRRGHPRRCRSVSRQARGCRGLAAARCRAAAGAARHGDRSKAGGKGRRRVTGCAGRPVLPSLA